MADKITVPAGSKVLEKDNTTLIVLASEPPTPEMEFVQAVRAFKKARTATNAAVLIKAVHAWRAVAKAEALAQVEREYGE